MMDRGVPVSADGVVGGILGYVHQARVVLEGQYLLYGSVRGVVIHHYYLNISAHWDGPQTAHEKFRRVVMWYDD